MPPGKAKPGPVPKEAIAFFNAKGIKPGFNYQDVWAEEHATSFTVAKILEEDVLRKIQDSLIAALEDGIPFEEWSKNIKNTLDEAGWTAYHPDKSTQARMNIIYNTNMRTARAVGQWDRIQRTKKTQPFLQYALGPVRTKHRDVHASWAGTIRPVDDSFWDYAMPPSAWNCKCHVIQLTRRRADSLGGVTKRPPKNSKAWKDPRTGRRVLVPEGVHPTFNYNPGKVRRGLKEEQALKDAQKKQKKSLTELKTTLEGTS